MPPKTLLSSLILFHLLGCANPSKFKLNLDSRAENKLNPPPAILLTRWKKYSPAELEKLEIDSTEKNLNWWKTYTLSSLQKVTLPAKSCQGFKTLSENSEFPLHDLALLRAYEVCPAAEKLQPLSPETSPLFHDLRVDLKLKDSQATADIKDDCEALTEKAQIENNKKNKEDLFLKALAVAEKIEPKSESELAQKKLQTLLYKNSPRLNPHPTFEDLGAVALDYRFHREFDKALAIYKKIQNHPHATKDDIFQSLKNIRMTYKVAQKKMEYLAATTELVNWTKKEFLKNKNDRKSLAHFHDSEVMLARTLWTEGQVAQAQQILKETQHLLEGRYPMDEVYYLMASMAEEKAQFAKALEFFEAALQQPISQPSLRAKITWLTSWNYYKLQKWPEARKNFEQMKSAAKDPSDAAKARYWLGRTLQRMNEKNLAVIEFESLIKEDPLGYYGMLAYRELGRKYPDNNTNNVTNRPIPASTPLNLTDLQEVPAPQSLQLEWLISVNEKSFAEKSLNETTEQLKKNNINTPTTWLVIYSAYARAGLYLPLFSTLGSLQPEIKNEILNNHSDLLFPEPYRDIVTDAAAKSEIPPEFIYSIIRQESAFNPEARSAVDAFGLMQLLPSVSKNISTQYKLSYNEALDLYKPEVNIPLGAFELKNLMKKYNDQFILAVSGYNANDQAIHNWLTTRYRKDPVEFIEEVPYEETRAYIKLTMRNYVFYKRLLNPGENISFPENLLKLEL